jgi:hypothetical protein
MMGDGYPLRYETKKCVRPLSDTERESLEAGLCSSDAFTLRRCQILLASGFGQRQLAHLQRGAPLDDLPQPGSQEEWVRGTHPALPSAQEESVAQLDDAEVVGLPKT